MSDPLPQRKQLVHTPPSGVSQSELYFITINGNPRGLNQFARNPLGQLILDSVKFHHTQQNWYCRLLVIMPDHLHLLVAFPQTTGMKQFITAWKSYLSKQSNVVWQRDFFDHRIRGWESLEAKADYIRQNPVRAKLVTQFEEWPWRWEAAGTAA